MATIMDRLQAILRRQPAVYNRYQDLAASVMIARRDFTHAEKRGPFHPAE